MSDSSINLVSGKTLQLEKEIKRLRMFRYAALASLIIVALVSVVVFVVNIALPIQSVKKDEQTTLTNISFLHKKLVEYSLIKDRIGNISAIIQMRKNYYSPANAVLGKIPVGVTVNSLKIESGSMTISVSADSLIPINQFIDSMVSLGQNGRVVKNLIIQSLSLNGTSGTYALSLQMDVL